MTEKKNAISQAQIDEWKAQFGHVYKTAMSQDMYDAQYAEWTAAMEG